MKVLVTGLFTQAGLFAIRRFGEMGFWVAGADGHGLAFGLHSKFVDKRIILPSLRKDPLDYAECLIEELEKERYDYYFPSFEESFVLADYKSRIQSLTRTVLQPRADIVGLHDKDSLTALAKRCGVQTPQTFAPRCLREARHIASSIDYPVYIKMRKSRNSTGLRLVEDPHKIWDAFTDVIRRNDLDESELPLIQRRISGPEVVLTLLAQRGRVVASVPYVGIRSLPRTGGTTTCRQTIREDSCAAEAAKLVSHMAWSGFVGMDFMRDETSGQVFLIDCNPRASVGLNAGHSAGVDLIGSWIKVANDEPAPLLPACRPNAKTSTEFADAIWYFGTYFKGPERWQERSRMRKKWRAEQKEVAYDVFDKKDIVPMLVLCLFLLMQVIKLVFTKTEPSELFLYHNLVDENAYNAKKAAAFDAIKRSSRRRAQTKALADQTGPQALPTET